MLSPARSGQLGSWADEADRRRGCQSIPQCHAPCCCKPQVPVRAPMLRYRLMANKARRFLRGSTATIPTSNIQCALAAATGLCRARLSLLAPGKLCLRDFSLPRNECLMRSPCPAGPCMASIPNQPLSPPSTCRARPPDIPPRHVLNVILSAKCKTVP